MSVGPNDQSSCPLAPSSAYTFPSIDPTITSQGPPGPVGTAAGEDTTGARVAKTH